MDGLEEVLASVVKSVDEGLVLSFEKIQIAILCLPLHLMPEHFNLQDMILPNILFLSTKSINVFV